MTPAAYQLFGFIGVCIVAFALMGAFWHATKSSSTSSSGRTKTGGK